LSNNLIQLQVAILEPTTEVFQSIKDLIERRSVVESVIWFDNPERLLTSFEKSEVNTLFINIFSMGAPNGIKLIQSIREKYSHVPICLLGTRKQLSTFPDVPSSWKRRFNHYYWFNKDLSGQEAKREIAAIIERMAYYLVSKDVKAKLQNVREYISKFDKTSNDQKFGTKQVLETLELAEKALEAKQKNLTTISNIVPGFENEDVQNLIKETLERSSAALKRTSTANIGVLIVGGLLVLSAFVVGVFKSGWEPVMFGGIGIAGIITSLIANPLKSIGNGARHLVQVQLAYLGFFNQLLILSQMSKSLSEEAIIERSKQVNMATTNILESLKKTYG
jgi:hypothetical protein